MIKIETRGDILYILMDAVVDITTSTEFKSQSKAWLLQSVKAYVFDFEKTNVLAKTFYQTLLQFHSTLKGTDKTIHSINLTKDLINQINSDGMNQIFSQAESLDEVKKKISPEKKIINGIDTELIKPFLSAVVKTLEIQANTKIKLQKIHLKTGPAKNIAIAGVISLITDNITGSITLCFTEKVFLKIYENMFGEVHTSITKEIEDAAGELLNIIYGQAKIELNNKPGYNLKKAFPTIFVGDAVSISQQGSSPAVVIPFETESGNFHIEIEAQHN